MFADFILPYQLELAEELGLIYYGCCEPLNNCWEHIERIPNLRRVSVSLWCDENFMAEALGRNYVLQPKA